MKKKAAVRKAPELVMVACGVLWGETGAQKIKRLVLKADGTLRINCNGLFVEEEEGPELWRHTVHFPEKTSLNHMREEVA